MNNKELSPHHPLRPLQDGTLMPKPYAFETRVRRAGHEEASVVLRFELRVTDMASLAEAVWTLQRIAAPMFQASLVATNRSSERVPYLDDLLRELDDAGQPGQA